MLSPHVPDLGALEVLVAVARTGSLTAAAAELGVTQQAVSARVRAIEAQVGVPLLVRAPRGVNPTSAGQALVQWAARVLDAAAQLDAGVAALRGDRDARLRIAASLTIAEHLLPQWLVALGARRSAAGQPPAGLELRAANSAQVAEQVASGQVELGFVEGPHAPRGLRWRTVAQDRLVVVVRADHPWSRRRTALPAAALGAASLVTRERGSGTRTALEGALAKAGKPVPAPGLELPSTAAVRAAVLAGAGPAALSMLTVSDDIAVGRLVAVPVDGLDLSRSLRAVWASGANPPPGPARDLVALALELSRG